MARIAVVQSTAVFRQGMGMDVRVLAAVIAAIASIVAAVISAWRSIYADKAARRSAELNSEVERRHQQAIERLRADLLQEAEVARRRLDADEVLARYRDPLASAAFDLQLRLENIRDNSFLEAYVNSRHPRRREAVDSTLFRISQFFGWREALQQGVQFLNFKEPERSKRVSDLLAEITMAWATDQYGQKFMIWQESQRAIGELMLRDNDEQPSVRGFAWFSENLSMIEPYLRPVQEAIEKGLGPDSQRLSDIRDLLERLVKELDPEGIRFLYKSRQADTS